MQSIRATAAVLLLSVVAACSPYSYGKEVAAISDGVNKLSDAFKTGYDAPQVDRNTMIRVEMIDKRAKVDMTGSCLSFSDDEWPPCALAIVGKGYPERKKAEEVLANAREETMAALKVLKEYANALAAVTNAADRTAYDSAVAQLSGAVGTLAAAAGPVAPGAATVAPAAVNLIGWLFGTALDQQRFASLKAGITAADTPLPDANGVVPPLPPKDATEAEKKAALAKRDARKPINIVTARLGQGLKALRTLRRATLYAEAQVLLEGLPRQPTAAAYTQRLSDAQAVVDSLDKLRKSDPTGAAADLAKAHAALVAAVNDPSKSYGDLINAVQAFGDKVAALHSALSAATAPKKGS